ncbi:unnamed protein product, partial [Brassica oleracea]
VLDGRDVLIQHLGKVIGNGDSTKLWHDPWLSTSSPKEVEGPLTLDDKDLVVADVLTRETCIWNRTALEKQFPTLLDEILLLHLSTTGAENSYAWLLHSSCSYTAKSGYISRHRLNLPPIGTEVNLFPWIVWFIWTARNFLIFETRHTEPTEVLSKAIAAAKEWITA